MKTIDLEEAQIDYINQFDPALVTEFRIKKGLSELDAAELIAQMNCEMSFDEWIEFHEDDEFWGE